jgi:hypothetical protein
MKRVLPALFLAATFAFCSVAHAGPPPGWSWVRQLVKSIRDSGADFSSTGVEFPRAATPCVYFRDSDATNTDSANIQAQVCCDMTDTGAGTEDTDCTLSQQVAGTLTSTLTLDADGSSLGLSNKSQTECSYLLAGAINCLNTGGCADPAQVDGTNFTYSTAAFDTATDEAGSFTFGLPANLTGTTASIAFAWASNNAACDDEAGDTVCWTVDGDSFANDAAFNTGALGGTIVGVTDTCIANGDLMVTSEATFTHSMAASETAVINVLRDVDAGTTGCTADAYPADAELVWVRFCYEVDNVFSGE